MTVPTAAWGSRRSSCMAIHSLTAPPAKSPSPSPVSGQPEAWGLGVSAARAGSRRVWYSGSFLWQLRGCEASTPGAEDLALCNARYRRVIGSTSAASGNVCPVEDFAEATIVGVAVPPGDVVADHAGLLVVGGVVGAVHGEGAQRGELGLDAVEPGALTLPSYTARAKAHSASARSARKRLGCQPTRRSAMPRPAAERRRERVAVDVKLLAACCTRSERDGGVSLR